MFTRSLVLIKSLSRKKSKDGLTPKKYEYVEISKKIENSRWSFS